MSARGKYTANVLPMIEGDNVDKMGAATVRDSLLYLPGALIEGCGIYVCKWHSRTVSKTFNLFAAPEDLGGKGTSHEYNDAVLDIHGLKDWHGADGGLMLNEAEDIETFLQLGRYKGQWIMPTIEMLYGTDENGRTVLPKNIFALHDQGAFAGTFQMELSSNYSEWYWSSTPYTDNGGISNWAACLFNGEKDISTKNGLKHSCRPVRLLEVK